MQIEQQGVTSARGQVIGPAETHRDPIHHLGHLSPVYTGLAATISHELTVTLPYLCSQRGCMHPSLLSGKISRQGHMAPCCAQTLPHTLALSLHH